jgi:hypothetical protein
VEKMRQHDTSPQKVNNHTIKDLSDSEDQISKTELKGMIRMINEIEDDFVNTSMNC